MATVCEKGYPGEREMKSITIKDVKDDIEKYIAGEIRWQIHRRHWNCPAP